MHRLLTACVCVAMLLVSACETLDIEANPSVREIYVPKSAAEPADEVPVANEVTAAAEARATEASPAVEARAAEQKPRPKSTGPRTFGHVRRPNDPITPLATIAANPTRYEGSQVRTEGEILRVCQRRGCWLELRDESGTRVFVPMAGHQFTVPIGSAGGTALVEGKVHRRERSHSERKHLESDGAGNTIPALSIEANAVVIR